MINIAVEGASDVELAQRVVRAAGQEVGRVIAKRGKTQLDPLLSKYNQAARVAPWVIFRDTDTQCPVTLHASLTAKLGEVSRMFLLRLAHPMSEGWLLADRDGFADFFSVKRSAIPADPESLVNAKRTVLDLCERSRSRSVRDGMLRPDRSTGPLYVATINEFAATSYDVAAAGENSPSLNRSIRRIASLPTL